MDKLYWNICYERTNLLTVASNDKQVIKKATAEGTDGQIN